MASREKRSGILFKMKTMLSLLLALVLLVQASTLNDYTILYFAPHPNRGLEYCNLSEEVLERETIKKLLPCLISQTTLPGSQRRTTLSNTSVKG